MKKVIDNKQIYIIQIVFIFSFFGCKKWITVNPPDSFVTGSNVFNSDATAIATMTGMYSKMSTGGNFATGANSISVLSGLSADEFTLFEEALNSSPFYYKNA